MKPLRDDVQDVAEPLGRGVIISLKVGINPKTGKPAFLPQFVERDNLLEIDGRQTGSFRVFIPDREVEYQKSEIWMVEVESWNISNKVTRDNRRYIYVYVKVTKRVEHLEHDPDFVAMKFFIRTKSGDRILQEKLVPIKAVPAKFYRDKGKVVKVRLYMIAGKVFDIGGGEYFSREKFVLDFTKTIGKLANAVSLSKAFDKLPELPEMADIKSIIF